MSSDEVRLRPSYNGTGYMTHDGGDSPVYIALPAAKHAALMRVVEAVKARIECEDGADGVGISEAIDREHHRWLVKRENAAYRAYAALAATAPERQGEAPRA